MRRLFIPFALFAAPALADPPVVEAVQATPSATGWSFAVTLRHADTGWDDYADGWRVELADGTVVGERPLAHPHVTEQPFTPATSGVAIPEGTAQVFVRARTNVEGWAADRTAVDLP